MKKIANKEGVLIKNNEAYWSSTEYNNYSAYNLYSRNGGIDPLSKQSKYSVLL